MKRIFNVRSLVLLVMVLSIGASAASAQKKQPAAGKIVWQDVKLELWDLSFSLPKDMKAVAQADDEKPDPSAEDFSESIGFRRSTPKAQRLDLSIWLRNIKGEKVKTERGGKPIELTPEELLMLDFIGDDRDAKDPDGPVLQADYHMIDGVNGILVVINADLNAGKSIKPTNDIRVIWGTYRLFKGNVRQVMFAFEGKRTQLATMMKVIDSLKFRE